jgi:hypothetical protein
VKLRRQLAGDNPVSEAVIRYVASALLAVVVISVLGLWLLRRAGEAEAIRDAKDQTGIAAHGSVEPALSDGLLRGEATSIEAVDRAVQERVLSDDSIARVKIWNRSGRIVYSDEPQLIGKRSVRPRTGRRQSTLRRVTTRDGIRARPTPRPDTVSAEVGATVRVANPEVAARVGAEEVTLGVDVHHRLTATGERCRSGGELVSSLAVRPGPGRECDHEGSKQDCKHLPHGYPSLPQQRGVTSSTRRRTMWVRHRGPCEVDAPPPR